MFTHSGQKKVLTYIKLVFKMFFFEKLKILVFRKKFEGKTVLTGIAKYFAGIGSLVMQFCLFAIFCLRPIFSAKLCMVKF
jgi:hypothetical protein